MEALFNGKRVQEHWNSVISSIDKEIHRLPKSSFTNSTIDELTAELIHKYSINIPQLLEEEIYMKKPEDVRIAADRRSVYGPTVEGTKFTFVVPFKGDSLFFNILPSRQQNLFPSAKISGNELLMIIQVPLGSNTSNIREEIDKNIDRIKTYLSLLDNDAKIFRNGLQSAIRGSLQNRKRKLDNDDEVANSFGFPVR